MLALHFVILWRLFWLAMPHEKIPPKSLSFKAEMGCIEINVSQGRNHIPPPLICKHYKAKANEARSFRGSFYSLNFVMSQIIRIINQFEIRPC